ncbi:MAG: hypothetical protein ACOX6E_10875 [Syntrophomonadaceae bacterium]|jgi:uncharacterized membrane protein
MSKVIAYFNRRDIAEEAVNELRDSGFKDKISLIAKENLNNNAAEQDISNGALTGSAVGGIAGLAMGAGALLIPGIGPLIAAGPLSGVIAGAITGGVAGGLIDYGIPEDRSQYYENKVKEGNILAIVETSKNRINEVKNILKNNGAMEIESHS